MNQDALPPATPNIPEFKDRTGSLKLFGVLEMFCGALAALMVPLTVLGQIMASRVTQDAIPVRQMVNGLFMYGLAAVALVWVGIGSWQARRWARALSLVISWSWLLVGIITLGFMIVFLPTILNASQPPGQAIPDGVQVVVKLVALGFVGIIFVVVPLGFVCFYQSRHVKGTCEARDPAPRWTDSCPLPLLAFCLWLGFGALTMLLMPVSANGVVPVFGQFIYGPAGWLACLILAGVLGYCGWAMYGRRQAGWWLALGTICLGSASGFITLSRVNLMDMYRLMGYGERQIEMMKPYTFIQGQGMANLSLCGAVMMLAYLLFVRQYFRARNREAA